MKRKFKTLSAIALCAVLSASAIGVAACAPQGNGGGYVDDQGIIHLVFAGRSNDSEEANYQAFIDQFMEENPNYDITIDWSVNENSYMLKLKGMGANLPDLFMLSDDQFIAYAESGLIADYKEFVDVDELNSKVYQYAAEAYCYNTKTDLYGWDANDPDCGFYGYP